MEQWRYTEELANPYVPSKKPLKQENTETSLEGNNLAL